MRGLSSRFAQAALISSGVAFIRLASSATTDSSILFASASASVILYFALPYWLKSAARRSL